jgi:exodeoxyribonuclease VII small subunit
LVGAACGRKEGRKELDEMSAEPVGEMSFEQSMRELEEIVARLERGDVELEKSIAIFERGEALRKHCDELLRKAEARVEKIALDKNGEPAGAEPLDPER